jgi:predicted DNA-binding protein
MAAMRTQVYLTTEQRQRLDHIVRRRGVSMAQVVREAMDRYLAESEPDLEETLAASFGSMPNLQVPSRNEWDGKPTH